MSFLIVNQKSDSFLYACNSLNLAFFHNFFLNIHHLINIKTLTTFCYFLQLALSLIFNPNKKGTHQKLKAFRDNLQFQITKFIIFISIIYCIFQTIDTYKSDVPCLLWNGTSFTSYFHKKYSIHSNISVVFATLVYIIRLGSQVPIFYTRLVFSSLFIVIYGLFTNLGGYLSLANIFSDFSLTLFFSFFIDVIPSIGIILLSTISYIVFLPVSIVLATKSDTYTKQCGFNILLVSFSFIFTTFSNFMLFRRSKTIDWFKLHITLPKDQNMTFKEYLLYIFGCNKATTHYDDSPKENNANEMSDDAISEFQITSRSTSRIEDALNNLSDEVDDEDDGAVIPEIVSDTDEQQKFTFEITIIENLAIFLIYHSICFIFASVIFDFNFGIEG